MVRYDSDYMLSLTIKDEKQRGTPVICLNCGWETKVRLKKGVKLKKVQCWKCGRQGFKRNTEYDKERRKKQD